MNKPTLYLRPKTEAEFQVWQEKSFREYSVSRQKEGYSKEDADKIAIESRKTLLPEGLASKNQYVYSVINGSELVGTLWWGLQKKGSGDLPWVYDIYIEETARGKGFGRGTMELAEQDVKAKGYKELGLHVFGYNKVAQSLYFSMGFETSNLVLNKKI